MEGNELSFSGRLWLCFGITVPKCPECGVNVKEEAGETPRRDWKGNCRRRGRVSKRGHIVRKTLLITGTGRQCRGGLNGNMLCYNCIMSPVCLCTVELIIIAEQTFRRSHLGSPLSVFHLEFSLMLPQQPNGDCTPLPGPFIPTRGPGLINDWSRACTVRRAVNRQRGSRGRKAAFILSYCLLCVCVGGTEAIFQLRRHCFTFGRERLGRKAG